MPTDPRDLNQSRPSATAEIHATVTTPLLAETTTHLPEASLNVAAVGESIAVIAVTVAIAVAVPPDGAAAREALVVNASQRSPGNTGTAGLIPLVQPVLPLAAALGNQIEMLDQLVVQGVTLQQVIGMCPLDLAPLGGILSCLAASPVIEATETA
jgi:hypothetical protein